MLRSCRDYIWEHRREIWGLSIALMIATVLSMLLAAGKTWSWKAESPDHTLTYTKGVLLWDSNTNIREDGSAELSVFQARYDDTVNSENGDKTIAPGTQGQNVIRLLNRAANQVSYTAVMYTMKTDADLPVETALECDAGTDTDTYSLPEGISREQVIRAVRGTVDSDRMREFLINWNWRFEEEEPLLASGDELDTSFGQKAAFDTADEVTVGFYIVVEDNGTYEPIPPKTGDMTMIGLYAVLFGLSLACMILLLIVKRNKDEERE